VPVLLDNRCKGLKGAAIVRRAIRAALEQQGVPLSSEISVVLGEDAFIQALNLKYMGIDAPTDVLSFPQEEAANASGKDPAIGETDSESRAQRSRGRLAPRSLGDIVISLPTVERQAMEHGVSYERELALVSIHATLHLLGFDHAEAADRNKMWVEQDRTLALLMDEPLTPGQ
jgi:probable rRNA maturation factor